MRYGVTENAIFPCRLCFLRILPFSKIITNTSLLFAGLELVLNVGQQQHVPFVSSTTGVAYWLSALLSFSLLLWLFVVLLLLVILLMLLFLMVCCLC